MAELRQTFRPEFLNRIDDIITFKPLTQEQIAKVVELQMNRVKKMLEPQGFELCWTPAAISYLAEVGYDPEFGEASNNTFPFSRQLTFGLDLTF